MAALTAAGPLQRTPIRPLRPLPLWQAALLFAVPAAAMALAVYWLWPALTALGVPKVDGRFYVSTLVVQAVLVLVPGPAVALLMLNQMAYIHGEIQVVRFLLAIPVAMIVIAACLVAAAVVSWRRAYWSGGLRPYFTIAALASCLLLGLMRYCNMIGCSF